MLRQGAGGRIINIASNASKQASAMGAAYSASKFAVLGLTQASALDLAPHGITVNAICPGPINTDRMSYWERSQADAAGVSMEEFRAQIVEPAGRATRLAGSPRRKTWQTWSVFWFLTKPISSPARPLFDNRKVGPL